MIQWCLGRSFLFRHWWHSSTVLHSQWLLQASCPVLGSGPMSHKLTVPPHIISLLFPTSWISSVFQLLLPLVSFHPFSEHVHIFETSQLVVYRGLNCSFIFDVFRRRGELMFFYTVILYTSPLIQNFLLFKGWISIY